MMGVIYERMSNKCYCPHCNQEYESAWELWVWSHENIECNSCGKTFDVDIETELVYYVQ